MSKGGRQGRLRIRSQGPSEGARLRGGEAAEIAQTAGGDPAGGGGDDRHHLSVGVDQAEGGGDGHQDAPDLARGFGTVVKLPRTEDDTEVDREKRNAGIEGRANR